MKINILKMVQENFQATWLMAGFFNLSLNNYKLKNKNKNKKELNFTFL
jgi:hypothetical protein